MPGYSPMQTRVTRPGSTPRSPSAARIWAIWSWSYRSASNQRTYSPSRPAARARSRSAKRRQHRRRVEAVGPGEELGPGPAQPGVVQPGRDRPLMEHVGPGQRVPGQAGPPQQLDSDVPVGHVHRSGQPVPPRPLPPSDGSGPGDDPGSVGLPGHARLLRPPSGPRHGNRSQGHWTGKPSREASVTWSRASWSRRAGEPSPGACGSCSATSWWPPTWWGRGRWAGSRPGAATSTLWLSAPANRRTSAGGPSPPRSASWP